MASLAFHHLSPEERLALIGELWDSLDAEDIPLTDAQRAEIDCRLATLDNDVAEGQSAEQVVIEFSRRYR